MVELHAFVVEEFVVVVVVDQDMSFEVEAVVAVPGKESLEVEWLVELQAFVEVVVVVE